jgi:hypothetical protein
MGAYRLHRGWREPNGLITDHVTLARVIKATTAADAMASALPEGSFLIGKDANLAWLTDEPGVMAWSLRLDDEDIGDARI